MQVGGFRGEGGKGSSLAYVCVDAADGDGWEALALALDALKLREAGKTEAAAVL